MFEIYSLRAETEVKLDWPNLPTTPAVMLAWLILTIYFIISLSAKKVHELLSTNCIMFCSQSRGTEFQTRRARPNQPGSCSNARELISLAENSNYLPRTVTSSNLPETSR